jgi:chromate transporter
MQRAGIAGGVVSWLGFTLPSAVLLVLFGLATASIGVAATGWVHGLKLAAAAVVAQAVIVLARSLTPDPPRVVVAVAAAIGAVAVTTPFTQVALIAAGALAGLLLTRLPVAPGDRPPPSPITRRAGCVALVTFVALLAGLPLLVAATGSRAVAMFDTFYRTGSLVFGGGHVVLPLLDAGVVDPGWVAEDRFLAGYGAAQAVPGPLFSFAAYLGSVAVSPLGGWSGAAVALGAIYLPSFLLIVGALPFWHRLRDSPGVQRALLGANAAVVGLLAAAFYDPILTGAIASWLDAAVAAVAFGLLTVARLPPIAVVALCAAAGQAIADLA